MSRLPKCLTQVTLCAALISAILALLGCGTAPAPPVPPGGNPSGLVQLSLQVTIDRVGLELRGIDMVLPGGGMLGELDNVLVRDSVNTETLIMPTPYPSGNTLRMRPAEPIDLADRDGNVEIIVSINEADGLTLFTSATETMLLRGEIKFEFEIRGGRLTTFPARVDQFILPTSGGTAGDFAFTFSGLPPATRVEAAIQFQTVTPEGQVIDHTVEMQDLAEMDGVVTLTSAETLVVTRITGMTFTFLAP